MFVSILTDAQQEEADAELREINTRLLRQLKRAKAKTEDLVDAVYRAAKDATVIEASRVTPPPPKTRTSKRGEVALWHLTDWQGAKRTTSYNSDVMKRRVMQYVELADKITDIQRADHPVKSCAILFGGDMLEGLFQFPTQAFEVDATLFEQWTTVSRLITDVVRAALATHQDVTVFAEWGNHGRIGSKRDGIPRADNLDRMCYETARMMLAGEPRLSWEDCPEDIQRVEIGNYRALSMHGDETGRNGYTSPSTFLNYLNKLKAGGFGWDFRDVYTGHRHTHTEMPLADGGAWFQTGSTESDNRYARDSLGSAAQPSQRLHFVDSDKGRVTSQHKVYLD